MQQITTSHVQKMLVEAAEQVLHHKEEINNANVFPVPDSDTGSNLSNTLEGIKKTALASPSDDMLISHVLESALLSAQGNSGIVFTAFLNGMLVAFKHKEQITIEDFRVGIKKGYESSIRSIQNPLKGTMIDLIEELNTVFQETKETDICKAFEECLVVLKKGVYDTEEKMEVLKENHVVDAGAIGFYYIIKGFAIALGMKDTEDKQFVNERAFIRHSKDEIIDHVYEVVTILTNPLMDTDQLHEILDPHGNCLDIIEVESKIKIHIHTDTPDVIKEMISIMGDVESIATVDMRTNEIL